ncbi:hypothetical protein GCM10017767_05170 [Halomonas urumqiensis]|nr:hypothetical protein GCM10017767_05170 [Halomonas urumqiensis]
MRYRGRRPLESLNCWIARVGGIEFRGMNETSARVRAETYLRDTGKDEPIIMEPPK